MSPRSSSLLGFFCALGLALPASAQGKKKKDEKSQPASEAAKSTDAKPEPKKEDEDVVFDNRGLAKQKTIEKQQEDQQKYENDTPFADTAPDPVALREQRWRPGFGGAYRLGWAFPMGNVEKDAKFSDAVHGMIFLGGDFGYWPIPYLFAGIALTGGYVFPQCTSGVSCSGFDVRGGPEVIVRFLPFEKVTPIFGVGAGYEWMMIKRSTPDISSTAKVHGFEALNLQAGVDVRAEGQIFGMFLFYSLGKYTKESSSVDNSATGKSSSSSGDVLNAETHSWLGIGARGTIE